jgi:excisionase family DNA binding protein
MPVVGEDRTAHNAGRVGDSLTIAEAAALLGVHKNTVRNRIKNGTYKAETVITKRGPTYLIDRESLLTNLNTNTVPTGSQQLVNPQAMELVQELLRPFVNELGEAREQLGAERARREIAERERDELRRELEELRGLEAAAETTAQEIHRRVDEKRESPEMADDEQQGRGPVPDAGGPREAEATERVSWWRRVFGG